MAILRSLLLLWLALLIGAPSPATDTILIRGAHVFDGSGRAARVRDVIIGDGRIAAIGRRLRQPRDARIVEAAGMTLVPGLHDLHIHTRRQAFESPAALDRQFAPYVAAGVTSVNEYSVSAPMLPGIRALVAKAFAVPHLQLALRMGVPGGHGTESEFTNAITAQVTTPDMARREAQRLISARADLIKVFADGWRYGDAARADRPDMDLPTLAAIVQEAKAARIPVVTHTVTLAGAKRAARAGVAAVVHGIGDAPVDAELIRLMRRSGTAYVPTMTVYEPQAARAQLPAAWRLLRPVDRARERARLTRSVEPVPAYEARRWRILQDNLRALHRAGVRIGVGTDAGIGGVYHGWATLREIEWLVRLGLTPREALKAATGDAARIIGKGDRQGRITRGRAADLVLVAGRPDRDIAALYDVRRVFIGGREVDLATSRRMIEMQDTSAPLPSER